MSFKRKSLYPYLSAQNGKCAICWNPLSKRKSTEDHVVPKYWLALHGASHGLGNKVVAHEHCNGVKHDRLPTQFELDIASAIAFIVSAERRKMARLVP